VTLPERADYSLTESALSPFPAEPAHLVGLLAMSFLAGLSALPSGPAENDYKAAFAKHWQVSKEFTLAVAKAMPAEDYDFKPTPQEMNFGQVMVHIAAQNSSSCAEATGSSPPPSMPPSDVNPPPTDKQTAIKLLALAFDTCAEQIDGVSQERWNKEVYKFQGEPVLGYEALWYAFTHTAHHRAQAEVYLRLKNIKPPSWRF